MVPCKLYIPNSGDCKILEAKYMLVIGALPLLPPEIKLILVKFPNLPEKSPSRYIGKKYIFGAESKRKCTTREPLTLYVLGDLEASLHF